ncbi:type II secretion system GspH family protein [bacterium]|nr:type II secretion system GspH family protein [bacterium]MBU1025429.1 type II secretion system GspH family protein [bacterium]
MTKKTKKNTNNKGFTLVELLVVVGILAILTVLAVPVYSRAKNTALEAGAIKGLEAMYDAYQLYYRDHGFYPPARSTYSTEFYNHVRQYLPRDLNSATVTDGFIKGYEVRSLTRPFAGASTQNGVITGSHYFTVMAIPLNTGRGLRTFFIEPNGIVTDGNTENPV